MAATYAYTGKDRKGKMLKGTMNAGSKQEVAQRLREQGYYVVSIAEKKEKQEIKLEFFQPKRVKLGDLVVFCRQMATMFESGLSLVETLEILADQTDNKVLKDVTRQVLQDVEVGKTLFAAMSAHPKVFPKLFRQMIKAGEAGGVLETVLNRMADHYEKELALNQKIKSALMYPMVIVFVAIGVVIFLMTAVIPNFVSMFAGFGRDLPLPTQIIISVSSWMQSFWWVIMGGLAALIMAFKWYYNQPQGRFQVDSFLLRMPVFGPMLRKVTISQFSRTMSTLTSSGVPLLDALRIVEEVVGNQVIAKSLNDARSKLGEGVPLSRPLIASKNFPKMVTQMIHIGEETGALDTMLSKIADFYDQEVDSAVQGMVSLIEPVLIVVIAVVVGFIVISIMLPMFDMIAAF